MARRARGNGRSASGSKYRSTTSSRASIAPCLGSSARPITLSRWPTCVACATVLDRHDKSYMIKIYPECAARLAQRHHAGPLSPRSGGGGVGSATAISCVRCSSRATTNRAVSRFINASTPPLTISAATCEWNNADYAQSLSLVTPCNTSLSMSISLGRSPRLSSALMTARNLARETVPVGSKNSPSRKKS